MISLKGISFLWHFSYTAVVSNNRLLYRSINNQSARVLLMLKISHCAPLVNIYRIWLLHDSPILVSYKFLWRFVKQNNFGPITKSVLYFRLGFGLFPVGTMEQNETWSWPLSWVALLSGADYPGNFFSFCGILIKQRSLYGFWEQLSRRWLSWALAGWSSSS